MHHTPFPINNFPRLWPRLNFTMHHEPSPQSTRIDGPDDGFTPIAALWAGYDGPNMARPEKLLTARQIAALTAPGMHADGGGLYLRIDERGRKSWIFRYMITGKRRDMGLGPVSEVGLAEARGARDCAREVQRRGVDPIQARDEAPVPKATIPTFGEAADAYVKTHRQTWRNEKHADQWVMTLTAYCGLIRDKRVSDVATADVMAVLKPIWTKTPDTASRLRGRIESVLNAARAEGHIDEERSNPARWRGHLDKLLPKPKKLSRGHHPAMPWRDVPAFVGDLRRQNSISARALEFTVLTAARSGEVRLAEISEFDLAKSLWTVPAIRMKSGRQHRVPLTARAAAIVTELREAFPDARYIFPGLNVEANPVSNMTMLGFLRKRNMPFVVHGFRSSFADWRREATSFDREVAEAALAHVIGDETEAAYSRGDVLDKRRALMDAWAAFLDETPSAQIVTFPRRKAKL